MSHRLLAGLALPILIFAQSAQADFTVMQCNGPASEITQSEATPEELMIALGMNRMPTAQETILMRFETPSGKQVWNWTDAGQESLNGHCETQYYMKNKPLNGTWLLTQQGTQLQGCPEETAVPQGLTGTRELEWTHVFSPRKFLRGGQIKWDLEKIHQNHWTATARPIPELPGTVKITYDFQVRDPKTIDITGDVELKIDAGSTKIDCKGSIAIVAAHQG